MGKVNIGLNMCEGGKCMNDANIRMDMGMEGEQHGQSLRVRRACRNQSTSMRSQSWTPCVSGLPWRMASHHLESSSLDSPV